MEQFKNEIVKRLQLPCSISGVGGFRYWVFDDLLPYEDAVRVARGFPNEDLLKKRDSLREYKRVGVDFDNYDQIMEQITYIFHDEDIVKEINRITDLKFLEPDVELYAGGLSSMGKNSFLKPHLDNSHDSDGRRYRVLNLLYYVSENRKVEDGGNLVLFPFGMNGDAITVHSKFNRLVIMETNNVSFHAVDKVKSEMPRHCVSNYYFSVSSPTDVDYAHVTSFYSFPEEGTLSSWLLQLDRFVRQNLSKHYKSMIKYKVWHKR